MNAGDHVICINGRFHPTVAQFFTALPKEGHSYVIRDMRLGCRMDMKTGDVSLTLVGLVNPKADSKANLERGFSIERFRKLEELKATTRDVATASKEELQPA
jgi:hypothetical protein